MTQSMLAHFLATQLSLVDPVPGRQHSRSLYHALRGQWRMASSGPLAVSLSDIRPGRGSCQLSLAPILVKMDMVHTTRVGTALHE